MIDKKRKFIFSIIAIAILIFLDQASKFIAVKYLANTNGVDIIPDVFRLQYLENSGAAFGILEGHMGLFYLITIVVVLAIVYTLIKLPHKCKFIPMWICGIFLISGALGNFIDRIRLEYVVDFFYFELINFPIFNIADIYVCTAAVIYVLLLLFYYKEEDLDQIHIFTPSSKDKRSTDS